MVAVPLLYQELPSSQLVQAVQGFHHSPSSSHEDSLEIEGLAQDCSSLQDLAGVGMEFFQVEIHCLAYACREREVR
jgi:hypothetical protein